MHKYLKNGVQVLSEQLPVARFSPVHQPFLRESVFCYDYDFKCGAQASLGGFSHQRLLDAS